MSKEGKSKTNWLNLIPSLQGKLKANISNSNLHFGSLDDFPEKESEYQAVFVRLDCDFMNWQRWYIQCFSHQLNEEGYFFIKGYRFPKLSKNIKLFISSLLRWLFWNIACLIRIAFIRQIFMSKKLIQLTEDYGLCYSSFPAELQFLRGKGILFQKKLQAEAMLRQKLNSKDYLMNQMETKYSDRIIKNDVLINNEIKHISLNDLLLNNNGNVLVLAPHPDDELVGCGGTLLELSKLGATIHVVQMSQGATCSALKNELEKIRHTVRWHEAKLVAEQFSFNQYYWPSNSEEELDASEENEKRLLQLVNKLNPVLIFAPSDADKHIEHQIAFQLINNALKKYKGDVSVLKYPVWGALKRIDYAFDITKQSQKVLDAMYHYKVAMKAEDYAARMQIVWAYQGLLIKDNSESLVEVFSV
ncbi:PIG-L family deacetylase [Winogradskyella litoriviva]|uniref:PIG-L family deacetylase n=1 Tax=Winogradskyella litoriviva TaxID=1220182 RepID=A0ABX2E4M5_9FLAO|nr:PIG-L family deacetylase [Winogradskyella litoriviva]NRD23237.1 PIG-L family deacetylase [Winogradskyella litoriviva]